MSKSHKFGRPPKSANITEVLALDERGRWIPDDGKRHRAFSYREGVWPMAMWMNCECSLCGDACPGRRAMSKTSERWGCANGRSFARSWSKP